MEQLLNAELEVARTNPNVEDLVDTLDENGAQQFLEISRADLLSNGKLVPVGMRYYERKQQLVQNFQLLQQSLSQDELAIQHFSSIQLAHMYAEFMDMEDTGVVKPFVRVGEMAELAKYQQAAQTQLEAEDQVDLSGEEDEQTFFRIHLGRGQIPD